MPPGILRLTILCLVMGVGTGLAAFAPLFISLSPKRVNIIANYSSGLLLGAALMIVIPEGVEALYRSRRKDDHGHDPEMAGWVGGALLVGFIIMYLIHAVQPHSHASNNSTTPRPSYATHRHRASVYRSLNGLEGESITTPSYFNLVEPPSREGSPISRPTTPGVGGGMESPRSRPGSTRTGNSERDKQDLTSSASAGESTSAMSTVIGLLTHSLADGISLGASSLSPADESLDLIVFLAIMLHKAPTAFALASLLISTPSSPTFIRKSLIAFSLATPLGSLATYGILRILGVGEDDGAVGFWTGMALVLSGGTFLFVAAHASQAREEETGGQGPAGKTVSVVLGMLTPGLLSKMVGHGH